MLRRRRPPVLARVSLRGSGARPGSLRASELLSYSELLDRAGEARVVTIAGGVGRSMVAVGLATAAALRPRPVALLECDISRPILAASLGLSPTPGLAEYLRGEAPPEQLLQSLVAAGPATGADAEPVVCVVGGRGDAAEEAPLLGSERFGQAVQRLRSAYELTVADAPAYGAALEAVAAQSDLVIACCSAEETRERRWQRFTGLVVTDAPPAS